jgi:hypothetical protein
MGKPEAAVLLYDAQTRAVALRPVTLEVRHSYPIRKQQNSQSYLLGARAFCVAYGIETGNTIAFEPILEDGLVVFELDKGVVITRSPRTKSNGSPDLQT